MMWTKLVSIMALVPLISASPLYMLPSVQKELPVAIKSTVLNSFDRRAAAGQNTYQVVSGDTGNAIAAAYSITFNTLSQANPNVKWESLQIGQSLNMPSNRVPAATTAANGDTADSICAKFNCFSADLKTANSNANFSPLTAGTQLRVPAYGQSTTYTVVSGDYGYAIAQAFGISFDALSKANPGVDWNNLQIGQKLNVPAGVSPSTNTLPSSSTTGPTSTTTSVKPSSTTTTLTSTRSSTSVPGNPNPPGTTRSSTSTSTTSKPAGTTTITSTITSQTTVTITSTTTIRPTTATTTTTTTTTSTTTAAGGSATASVTGSNAVPTVQNDGVSSRPDTYTFYQGDGSPSKGWPTSDQWASFDLMWNRVSPYLGQSCQSQWNVANNSPDENQQIYNAIQDIAAKSKVDHRFILATITQESGGCVRAPTTYNGETNPGLMQDYNGKGTCNSREGGVLNPCPQSQIYQMIVDGTMGTTTKTPNNPTGGLVQNINNYGNGYALAQAYYRAARIYNSGSIPADSDLGGPGATRCYASDMANRLMGWVTASSTCRF